MIGAIGIAPLAVELKARLVYIRSHLECARCSGCALIWLRSKSCLVPLSLLRIDIQKTQGLTPRCYSEIKVRHTTYLGKHVGLW
jgi:hypothetical protein